MEGRDRASSLPQVGEPFDLRVVPLMQVVPHEEPEPRRVAKVVERLASDTVLSNPPLVAEVDDRLVLLDGANRIAALRALAYRHVIVQVVPAAEVRLEMWHHALLDVTPDRLMAALTTAPTLELRPGTGGPCTVRLASGRGWSVRPEAGVHPFAALSSLVSAYVDLAVVRRTTEPDIAAHPDAAAVVAFPQLGMDDVLGAVRADVRLPAGVTRFVVTGRVLLLNAALDPLRSDRPVEELNEWLGGLVAGRRAEARIRYYPEAVYVLDD
jgi:L-serine kinase (ATP) / ParB family transcriptional regulator, heme-responsive regulator